jgi:hypothetical protein
MAAFLDGVRFNPTLGGTTDWIVSSAVAGCQTPASAGAVDATKYKYHAESADLTQWEDGEGTYTVSTTTLTRTTVLYNSSGTGTGAGQSGAGTKISFTAVPQVAIVALAEDLVPQQVGQLPGTSTNNNASAGNVGEYIESVIAAGSAISLTSGVNTNLTSISLTAGDWDVDLVADLLTAGTTTLSFFFATISLVSAATDITRGRGCSVPWNNSVIAPQPMTCAVPPTRFSLSTTTTIFAVVLADFSVSTATCYGIIRARRVR